MPFPETRGKLKEAGYKYLGNKICPCGASMELWLTPNNATMPMNTMREDDDKAESHFASCPLAAQFRRKKP
jgi:hypothetical protein